ncbi:S-adenosyl-L-methionine-dependent methyltransferase [Xylaria telfairii]|nr:S-adenosyl-L-methionine-dependent methyltransferase [Xylaria telfairii]
MSSISPDTAKALEQQIDSVTTSLQNGVADVDESVRRRLIEAGLRLSLAFEVPHDTAHRLGTLPLQGSLAYVGINKGIFKLVADAGDKGISSVDLARETNVNVILMKRLLRYYQSLGMLSQTETDSFSPTQVTENLTTPICSVGVSFFHQVLSQSFLAVPQFLREANYENVLDPSLCAWNIARQTNEPPWKWLQSHPELAEITGQWMAVHRDGLPSFLDVIKFEHEFAREADDSIPLFVDIGGGFGHQCIAFRQKYPALPGRVILQDLPEIIAQVESNPLPGLRDSAIETQAHDFFTPQPVKGARAYYLRNILHNFVDEDCRKILGAIKVSMTNNSVILIDEIVLSEYRPPSAATEMDMMMMTTQAARERSEEDWARFLKESGFSIAKQCKYSHIYQDAVLVVVPQ